MSQMLDPTFYRSPAEAIAVTRPATWDADQEQAARATVVETHAGRVVPSARPHATEAAVRAMFEYDPLAVLPLVDAPITALVAMDDDAGSRAERLDALPLECLIKQCL